MKKKIPEWINAKEKFRKWKRKNTSKKEAMNKWKKKILNE